MLGADKGGIPVDVSMKIMRRYLSSLDDLNIEIYKYDPKTKDDLFEKIRNIIISQDIVDIEEITKINKSKLKLIIKAMTENSVCQICQLGALPGIGPSTLEKLFEVRNIKTLLPQQKSLLQFDSSNINPTDTEEKTLMSTEVGIPPCKFCSQPGYFGFGKPMYKEQIYTCYEHRNLVKKNQSRTNSTS